MTLRIATWNLQRPRADQSEKISVLKSRMREVDADIWILTDLNKKTMFHYSASFEIFKSA